LERAAALGIPRERMINLLNGCDPEGLTPFSVEEARSRLPSVPRAAYVVGYVGVMRATTAKLLFSALPLIKQLAQRPVKVLCIGNHKLKDFWSFVPADCRNDVVETGWIDYDDLNVYLCASDVTVLPFQHMTATDNIWPSKLNDYLAAGRPTVATNMRILRPLFSAYDIGLLTEDTAHAFAQGVVTLLLSPEVRARQAVNARALAEGDLSWEHLVGQLEQFYVQLIDQMAHGKETKAWHFGLRKRCLSQAAPGSSVRTWWRCWWPPAPVCASLDVCTRGRWITWPPCARRSSF